jgi:hypothetical protein
MRHSPLDEILREGTPARDPSDACGAPLAVKLEDSTGYNGHKRALAYAMPYMGTGTCIHVFIDRVHGEFIDHAAIGV